MRVRSTVLHRCREDGRGSDLPCERRRSRCSSLVAQMALDYRMQFARDVVIDIVCYRRHGPQRSRTNRCVTQPLMYSENRQASEHAHALRRAPRAGRRHPRGRTRRRWSRLTATRWRLASISNQFVVIEFQTCNRRELAALHRDGLDDRPRIPASRWTRCNASPRAGPDSGQSSSCIRECDKIIADRKAMGEGRLPLDWGMAENLAYASLLTKAIPCVLRVRTVGRGTFFHRHAVLHDQNRERWDDGTFIPLQHVSEIRPTSSSYDSLLSEEAVLGFEYGYATAAPDCAGDLGSPVRRFRQWRAGGDRSVHQLAARPSGAACVAW